MIKVSDAVIADFESHFSEHEKQDIRIYLAPSHDGHRLGLVLDHAQETDETFQVSDYTFCFQKGLLEKCGGINIDLNDVGFVVEPVRENALKSASCSGSCGSCASSCKQ